MMFSFVTGFAKCLIRKAKQLHNLTESKPFCGIVLFSYLVHMIKTLIMWDTIYVEKNAERWYNKLSMEKLVKL